MGLPDEQQTLVLNALRGAAGKPVSFSQLREAGVEFPASIVSELELAGVPIERCRGASGASVRLVEAAAPPDEPVPAEPPAAKPPPARRPAPPTNGARHPLDDEWTMVRHYRASSRDGLLLAMAGSKRMLAPLVLIAAIIAVAVILATGTGFGAGSRHPRSRAAERSHTTAASTTHTVTNPATQTTAASAASTTATTASPVSLALATQLEAQGHDLLAGGQSNQAVPVLKRALAATGEDVTACVEPQSTMCLTYAYALYDLGRALRLSGNPAAAVPILERRLQIDNQRPTVLAELELARQGAT